MRALTVRQPYAWAIMHGGKDVENRSRNIAGSYRGPVAITVGMTLDGAGDSPLIDAAIERLYANRAIEEVPSIAGGDDPWFTVGPWFGYRGAVLGVVDLVDVHLNRMTTTERYYGGPVCFDNFTPIGATCSEWGEFVPTGVYHLVLANPRPLKKPIPVRGRLGLWTLPDDIAAQVEEALR